MIAQTRPDIANVTEQTVVALKELEGRISVLKGDLATLCQGLGHPEAARIAASPSPGSYPYAPQAAFGTYASPFGAPFGTPLGTYGAPWANPAFAPSFPTPGFAGPWNQAPHGAWAWNSAFPGPTAGPVSAAQYAAAVNAAHAALSTPWNTPFGTPQATPSPFATIPAGYR